MLGRLKQNLMYTRTQRPELDLPLCVFCAGKDQQLSAVRDKGSGFSRSGRHIMSPTIGHWADNLQTVEQLYQRSSHTVVKVLGPQQIFQLGDLAKGLRTPEIWFWKPMGFHYRTFTDLGKQTLGGHEENLMCTRSPKEKRQCPHKRLSRHACECLGVSGGGVGLHWPAMGSGALNETVLA